MPSNHRRAPPQKLIRRVNSVGADAAELRALANTGSLFPLYCRCRTGVWLQLSVPDLARIMPCRTVDNVIEGMVLTFTDISRRFPAIGRRRISLNARRIAGRSGDTQLILLAMQDDGQERAK